MNKRLKKFYKMHRRLKHLSILAMLFVGLIALIDVSLQMFNIERIGYFHPDLYVDDPELMFKMGSNLDLHSHGANFQTGQFGQRGPSWLEAHKQGKDVVLFIGDSVMVGFGVDGTETISARFSEATKQSLFGVNLGCAAYNYIQAIDIGNRYLKPSRAKAIVYLFVNNDFCPTREIKPHRGSDKPGSVNFPGREFLRRRSALYALGSKVYNNHLVDRGIRARPIFNLEPYLGKTEESNDYFRDLGKRLSALNMRSEATVFVTILPWKLPILVDQRIKKQCEEAGLQFISLRHLFKDDADYELRATLEWDAHPNAKTHQEIAAVVTAAVDNFFE